MHSQDLIVRCMAWRTGDQWVAMCLDFDLAAQADTFEAARKKLGDQIVGYVRDALVGPDQDFADHFLTGRKAPLRYWLKFYWGALRSHVKGLGKREQRLYKAPLPLVPA